MELEISKNLKEAFMIALLGVLVVFTFAFTFIIFSSPGESEIAKLLLIFVAVLLASFFIFKNIIEILKDMDVVSNK